MIKILFVCMGNICRSPAAEEILRNKLMNLGKVEGTDFIVDSAATTRTHEGSTPDSRSQNVMDTHGFDISEQVSRPLILADGSDYDLVLCMDLYNLADVKRILPEEYHHKVRLLDKVEVEDPYWRSDGFEVMYQHLDKAIEELITKEITESII